MLSDTLELLIDFSQIFFEIYRPNCEVGIYIPNFPHNVCDRSSKFSLKPHHIIFIYLQFVRLYLVGLFTILEVSCKKLSHARWIRKAL